MEVAVCNETAVFLLEHRINYQALKQISSFIMKHVRPVALAYNVVHLALQFFLASHMNI